MAFLDLTGLTRFLDKLKALFATKSDTILETTLSRGRKSGTTVGTGSFAFGNNVEASDSYSQAFGSGTSAQGKYSTSIGYYTTANAQGAMASGTYSMATEKYSHANGENVIANIQDMHAIGAYNVPSKPTSSVSTWAVGTSYKIGDTVSIGTSNIYFCIKDHGSSSTTRPESGSSYTSCWTSISSTARSNIVEAVGKGTSNSNRKNIRALDTSGNEYLKGTLYVGCNDDSSGGVEVAAKADTVLTTTLSRGRKANTTVGTGSFAFGDDVTASGYQSYAEGMLTVASGSKAHAEGVWSIASGDNSHAENGYTIACEDYSHAQGENTISNYVGMHTFGRYNYPSFPSVTPDEWVSNTNYIIGNYVQYDGSFFFCRENHTSSSANMPTVNTDIWLEIGTASRLSLVEAVGWGNGDGSRKNIRTLDIHGSEALFGTLYVNCDAKGLGGTEVATKSDVSGKLDKTSVYNGLDKTASGFALDARQGKELNTKISHIDTRQSLITGANATSTTQSFSTYSSRKFSDYRLLVFYLYNSNSDKSQIRNCVMLPQSAWASGKSLFLLQNHGVNMASISGIMFSYDSDTSIKAVLQGAGSLTGFAIEGYMNI